MYNPYFYPPSLPPISYAGGGNVARQQEHGLAAAAEQLRRRGREGDTILAHISPEEAGILKLLGGSGTINPHTGLPEYKKFWKNITAKNIVKAVTEHPLETAAIIATAYYAPQIASSFAPATFAPEAAATIGAAEVAPVVAAPHVISSIPADAAGAGAATTPIAGSGISGIEGFAAGPVEAAGAGAPAGISGIEGFAAGPVEAAGAGAPAGISGIEGFAAGPVEAAGASTANTSIADTILGAAKSLVPTTAKEALNTALLGTMAYGTVSAAQETKAQREAAQAELARQEAKRQQDIRLAESVMEKNPPRYRRLTAADVRKYGIGMPRGYVAPASVVNPTLSPVLQAASGGPIRSYDDELGSDDEVRLYGGGLGTLQRGLRFARGGISSLPPRYLSGGGDGMSDSIPARIGGKQEARLADGEFVIPADVVSHIGNGSSNAGAKKLYAMMDRIRKARTGKTKQAPAIKTGRLMPA